MKVVEKKAFKETAARGPIYLFFSVNARSVFYLAFDISCILLRPTGFGLAVTFAAWPKC